MVLVQLQKWLLTWLATRGATIQDCYKLENKKIYRLEERERLFCSFGAASTGGLQGRSCVRVYTAESGFVWDFARQRINCCAEMRIWDSGCVTDRAIKSCSGQRVCSMEDLKIFHFIGELKFDLKF